MPYIIMKRDDIPGGTLQVLDLDPNTSQRNYTLDPPGQTKYVNPVLNDSFVLFIPTGMELTTFRDARGLAAWFITNVTDGGGGAAAGAITVGAGNALDGDTVSIGTGPVGGPNVTLTFRDLPTSILEVQIASTEDATANNLVGVVNGYLTIGTLIAFLEYRLTRDGWVATTPAPYPFPPDVLIRTEQVDAISKWLPIPLLTSNPYILPVLLVLVFLFVLVVML